MRQLKSWAAVAFVWYVVATVYSVLCMLGVAPFNAKSVLLICLCYCVSVAILVLLLGEMQSRLARAATAYIEELMESVPAVGFSKKRLAKVYLYAIGGSVAVPSEVWAGTTFELSERLRWALVDGDGQRYERIEFIEEHSCRYSLFEPTSIPEKS